MGKTKRDVRLRTKITISFVSIFLFFLLSEVIFRIIDKKSYQYEMYHRFEIYKDEERQEYVRIPLDIRDHYLFWRAPKAFEFRGIKYSIAKDRNTVRIICLGDSCTQGFMKEGGYYIGTQETYPSYLERLSNSYNMNPHRHFEVMNAGIGGYSSLQGLRYLQRDLLKYDPDIITVYFGINDNSPCVIYSDAEQRIVPEPMVNIHNVLMKGRLYQSAVRFERRAIMQLSRKKRVPVKDYGYNVEKLYRIAEERGIKLVIINCPTRRPDTLVRYNRVLKDIAVRYRIPLIDIVKEAEKYKMDKDRIFIDICHPTPYFNKIIAKEIYKALLLNNYI